MQYRHVQTIDGKGGLRGIAVDSRGQLYAAGDSEIKLFDAAGQLKQRWPTSRPALAVAVARDGAVYAGEIGQIDRDQLPRDVGRRVLGEEMDAFDDHVMGQDEIAEDGGYGADTEARLAKSPVAVHQK